MSIYAGLSLREVYERRCVFYDLPVNSAVLALLPESPDDFLRMKRIDFSANMLGNRGFLPLLEVIRCCKGLRSLNARGQQLGKDTIDVLCSVLRHHPSIRKINLSDNPLNITAGYSLLELVQTNRNIDVLSLDGTHIRNTVMSQIVSQVDANREANERREASAKSKALSSRNTGVAAATMPTTAETVRETKTDAAADTAGQAPAAVEDTSADVSLKALVGDAPDGDAGDGAPLRLDCRPPKTSVLQLLSSAPSSVHPMLFDESPQADIEHWLAREGYMFYDPQFAADDGSADAEGRRASTHGVTTTGRKSAKRRASGSTTGSVLQQRPAIRRYGVVSWQRVSELFPSARLLPAQVSAHTAQDLSVAEWLPSSAGIHDGFAWAFTCVSAVLPMHRSLPSLFDRPRVSPAGESDLSPTGTYVVRFFVDGSWRFVVIDDFLPVSNVGAPLFVQPVWTGSADEKVPCVWPCLFLKALAKLYGGYEKLDTSMPKEGYLSALRERPCFHAPPCARTLTDLTSGVGLVEELVHKDSSPHENASAAADANENVWTTMMETLCRVNAAQAASVGWTKAVAITRTEAGMLQADAARTGRSGGGKAAVHEWQFAGIALNCAVYQVLQVYTDGEIRLVQLWNPFTEKEWKGRWCDQSSLWRQNPALAAALNMTSRAHAASKNVSSDDATGEPPALRASEPFWMSFADFLSFFDALHLCRIFECTPSIESPVIAPAGIWRQSLLWSSWDKKEGTDGGGLPDSLDWYKNPHFRLLTLSRGFFAVFVCTRDARFLSRETRTPRRSMPSSPCLGRGGSRRPEERTTAPPIGFHVLQADRYPIRSAEPTPPTETDNRSEENGGEREKEGPHSFNEESLQNTCLFSTGYTATDCLCFEGVLEDSEGVSPYWIVPSRQNPQGLPDSTGSVDSLDLVEPFYLRVFSASPYQLSQQHLEDHWEEHVVVTDVASSGEYLAGEDNAQVSLRIRRKRLSAYGREISVSRNSNGSVGSGAKLRSVDSYRASVQNINESSRQASKSGFSFSKVCDSISASVLHSQEGLCGTVLIRVTVDVSALGDESTQSQAATALFVLEGDADKHNEPLRAIGPLEDDDVVAKSLYIVSSVVYAELPEAVQLGDLYNLLCCVQPVGTAARVEFRLWSTMPVEECRLLPVPAKQRLTVQWPELTGSGVFSQASGHPQIEIFPAKALDRFVVRMTMKTFKDAGASSPTATADAETEPVVMLTVLDNHGRLGEALHGKIPTAAILARSECLCGTWAQCEVPIGSSPLDSVIVIPCLQPAHSQGTCLVEISSDTGDFAVRELTKNLM